MTDRQHADLSPSSANRWLKCPGSLILSKDVLERPSSKYAEEGNLFHKAVEDAFQNPKSIENIKSEEIKRHVQGAYDFMKDVIQSFKKNHSPVTCYSEQRVTLAPDAFGTLDFSVVGKKGETFEAIVADFKYGAGVKVEVEENDQLLCYAFFLEKTLKIKFSKVFFFIYQPRTAGEVYARWDAGEVELETNRKRISLGIERGRRTLSRIEIPSFETGEHCRFCPALAICNHQKKEIDDVLGVSLENFKEG